MGTWFKRIFTALVVLILLAIAALGVFLLNFDPNSYKSRLQDLVHKEYGRTLSIQGDISMSLYPRLALSINNASLSERDSEELFAAVNNARLAVAIWPLLSKQLVVDHIQLDGLQANISRNAQGAFNFDDLLASQDAASTNDAQAGQASAATQASSAQAAEPGSELSIDIAGLALQNGRVRYQDTASGIDTVVQNINASTGRIAYGQAFDVSLQADVQGKQPVLDANFDIQATLTLAPQAQSYQAQKLQVALNGRLADLQQLKARLSANQLALNARNQALAIDKFAFKASGLYQQRSLELALDAPTIKLPAPADKAQDISLALKTKDGNNALTLGLATPVSWDDKTSSGALAAIKGNLSLQDPALPQGKLDAPLNGSLKFNLQQQSLELALKTVLEGSNTSLSASVQDFSKAKTRFAINSDRLDLNQWLGAGSDAGKATGKPAANGAQNQPKTGAATATPIDLSFLKGLDVNGSIDIGQLIFQNLELSKLSSQLSIKNDALNISKLSANLYQGSINGQLSANANNALALKLDANKIALEPLLKALSGKQLMSGSAQAQLDLKAQGASVQALERALAGNINWSVGNGVVYGIDARKSLTNVADSLQSILKGRLDGLKSPFVSSDQTVFKSFDGRVDFKQGIGQVNKLLLDSELVSISADKPAQIDVPRQTLDLVLAVKIVASMPTALKGRLDPLAGATIPVHISGPWAQPSYGVKLDKLAGQALKQTVQSELGNLLEKQGIIPKSSDDQAQPSLKESAKDTAKQELGKALKGLFNR